MQRKEIMGVLKKVSPALESKDMIPVFTCFCFDGANVTTYDGVVALTHPIDFGGVKGAVRGKLLLDFLSASRADDMSVEEQDSQVTVKAGRSKLDLPLLSEKDFLFSAPEQKGSKEISIEKPLLDAVGQALLSVGKDPGHSWRLGVTTVFTEDGCTLYSSDNRTATRVKLELKSSPKKLKTILPPKFCELLIELSRSDTPKKFILTEEWVSCAFKSGLQLFSRTIPNVELDTWKGLFEIVKDAKEQLTAVPKGLLRCLERAAVVLPFSDHPVPHTRMTVKGEKLILETESKAGNVRDVLTVEGLEDGKSIRFVPESAMKGMSHATKFAMLDQALVFSAPGYTYMVTLVEGAAASSE